VCRYIKILKFIIFILILIISNLGVVYSQTDKGIKDYLYNTLPIKLKKIVPGTSTDKDLYRIVGVPLKKTDGIFFYKTGHKKYDTTIGVRSGIVEYLIYQYRPGALFLEDLKKWIPKKQIDEAIFRSNKLSHESGRDFEVDLAEHNIKIVVSRNSQEWVKSVTFFEANK